MSQWTAHEVRAVARLPSRLVVGCVAALALLGAACVLVRVPDPPIEPSPFDVRCLDAAEGCAWVPADLARAPTGAQFAERAGTLCGILCEADPDVSWWDRPAGGAASALFTREPPSDPARVLSLVEELGSHWSPSPPTEHPNVPPAWKALFEARGAALDRARMVAYQEAWDQVTRVARVQQMRATPEYERVRLARGALLVLAALLELGAFAGSAAWSLAEVEVAAELHHLVLGRRRIPWSEVERVDLGALTVEAGGRRYRLPLRALDPADREALTRACDEALARARSAPPADPEAIRRIERLRARSSPTGVS